MPFYTNTSGYIDTGGNAARACPCSGGGPEPAQGGALVQAMRMVVNSKIDAALERAAPIRANAKGGKPLGPSRGVLSGKAHNATEQAPKRAYRTRWGEVAKVQGKPSTNAPLRPRGIIGGGA